jgi:hypothetical protein
LILWRFLSALRPFGENTRSGYLILEKAIQETENKLLNTMPNEQHNDYYDMKITLRSNNHEEPLRNEKLTRQSKTA